MSVTLRGAFVVALAALAGGFLSPDRASAQSENVTLLANVDQYSYHSACWGYTSPEGVEIAIIGTGEGTSFVDVTNTASPVEVLFVPGSESIWREMKTYGHYAYIVEDQCCDGLIVVDLADPHAPVVVNQITTHFGTSHTVWIDTTRGLLFANGTDAGVQIFDLNADPVDPPLVHAFNEFYVHDMSTHGDVAYLAAISAGFLATADLTTLPDTLQVLDTASSEGNFTHNVWVTEDGQYAYTTDEITGGHLTIFDVSDPENIIQVGAYINDRDPGSIVHNVFMEGNLAYVAWYKAGLEILDLSDPVHPIRVGYYDTSPGSGAGFDGAWGAYTFAESGHIYVSDMSTGLYVLEFNANYGFLEGVVTDLDTGLPLPGATVRASVPTDARSATTGADGFFRLVLDPGAYGVTISAFGYETEIRSSSITQGNTSVLNVPLDPLPTSPLSGVVSSGGPLSGVRVVIAETPFSTTTAANGSYSFPSVPQGIYAISASRFGFGASDAIITIQSGPNVKNFAMNASPIVRTMETEPSWTVGASGDNATGGVWTRVEPFGTFINGDIPVQPEFDHTTDPGALCFVTGQGMFSGAIGEADVDGGKTTLLSAVYNLSAITKPSVRLHRWYVNNGNSSVDDTFRIDVSSNGGSSWTNLETLATTRRFWEEIEFYLPDYITPTSQVRFRFVAEDFGIASIVEAGIDDFEIFGLLQTTDAPDVAAELETRILGSSPNPMRQGGTSSLQLQLPSRQSVSVEIIDAAGRLVKEVHRGPLAAGTHTLEWDGRDRSGHIAPSGVFFQRVRTADTSLSAKIVVIP